MAETRCQMSNMTCRKCGATWPEGITLPVPVDAFTRRIKSITCPECGAGYKQITWIMDKGEHDDA